MKKILLLLLLLNTFLFSFQFLTKAEKKFLKQDFSKLKEIAKTKPTAKAYQDVAIYYYYKSKRKKSLEWFLKSFKKFKDGYSATYIGIIYETSFRDTKKALKWLHIGADLNFTNAYYYNAPKNQDNFSKNLIPTAPVTLSYIFKIFKINIHRFFII